MASSEDIKHAIEADAALSLQFRQAVEKFIDNIKIQAPIIRQRQADEDARNKARGVISYSHLAITDDLFKTDDQKEMFLLAMVWREVEKDGKTLTEAVQSIHDEVYAGYGEINYDAG